MCVCVCVCVGGGYETFNPLTLCSSIRYDIVKTIRPYMTCFRHSAVREIVFKDLDMGHLKGISFYIYLLVHRLLTD